MNNIKLFDMNNQITRPAIFFFFAVIAMSSCKSKKNIPNEANLGWSSDQISQYVSEHSPPRISVKEKITIRLTKAPDQITVNAGSTAENNIVSISPSVSGKFVWSDPFTLTFIADKLLTSNTEYKIKLNFDELYKDKSSLDEATLTLATLDQNLSLHIQGLEYNDINENNLTLKGHISTADYAENMAIEKSLKVIQDGNNKLSVMWDHVSDNLHYFTITGIVRSDIDNKVVLKYDGKEIDEDFKGERDIEIIKIGEFSFVSHKTTSEGSNQIEFTFSDVLKQGQDLNGFFKLDEKIEKLNYDIEANKIIVYVDQVDKSKFELSIDGNLYNSKGKTLAWNFKEEISFQPSKPELIALRNGVIMPESDKLWFPFQAKNLKFVDIAITKIYQNNVLQFLQYNSLNNTYDLHPVGKITHEEKIDLSQISTLNNEKKFIKYTLDLGKMIQMDKGAIYNVSVRFKKDYVINLSCKDQNAENTDSDSNEESSQDEYGDYEEEYDYDENDSPCNNYYYYGKKFINTNVLASNIGVIAKGSESNTWHIITSNIVTGDAINGAEVEIFNFQKQQIGKGSTSNNGIVRIDAKEMASFAIVKNNGEFGYLNLQNHHANTLSEFDISGKKLKNGLDAYIYGERGVYRPGDSMHIVVMTMNHGNNNILPSNFPVRLVLEDARGKTQFDKVQITNKDHVYYFPISTKASYPTGTYKLIAHLGSEKFVKNIKVETVKPNRLKIQYADEKKMLNLFSEPSLSFESKWLHGASAEGLKTEVDITYTHRPLVFTSLKGYNFSDPARTVDGQTIRTFEGNLNDNGKANYKINQTQNLQPSEGINAVIKTRVFEKSGNFSDDYVVIPANKYNTYVGLKIPESSWGGHYLKSDQNQIMNLVTVNTEGKPAANRKLIIGLYDAEWNWWYNESNYNLYKFNSDKHLGSIKTYEVKTNNKGEATFTEKYERYQNYMIRVCDQESGHCTGGFFYTSPWGDPPSNSGAPQLITLKTDKSEYTKGDEIKLRIPSNSNSKIIVSIEKGTEVEQVMRLNGSDGETVVNIPVTQDMTPNVYIHASLIQPYNSNTKGLPMRMYGILPLKIVNPEKQLSPQVNTKDVITPNENFIVSVSEKNNKGMTYTLAVVDEGLLDLTRFKTPDPLDHFYSKLSLNVNTFDIYDLIMNPYGDEIENLFSIGGDEEAVNLNSVKKANRFVPTVKFIGPFDLKTGSNNHVINIKNYVGSVRIMVVAKNGSQFGKGEKTCAVKKDLMIQNTLPRVLSPGDEVALGANVFVTNSKIKNVSLSLDHNEYFTPVGKRNEALVFNKEGDDLKNFFLKVNEMEGIGKAGSTASSGNIKSTESIEIDVRNPNSVRSEVKDFIIESGKNMTLPFDLFGTNGTNKLEVEVSNQPSINISKRLQYLISYPHGCIEQTTSSVFPQVYLADVTELSNSKKNEISKNISAGIQRLALFQTSNGGFAYWPGNREAEDWASSYAGHFLVEAKNKAHYVPENILIKWAEFQKNKANTYNGAFDYTHHGQAYRLYTLAKYGKPELGAMNRLKSIKNLDVNSIYTLAAAYAIVGKKDIATQMISNIPATLSYKYGYEYDYYTYGSELRNKASKTEALIAIGREADVVSMIKSIAKDLNSNQWYNTQATSYALMVIQKAFSGKDKNGLLGEISYAGKSVNKINTNKGVLVQEIRLNQKNKSQNVIVNNQSKGKMFVRLIVSGKDPVMPLPKKESNMLLSVDYRTTDGKVVNIENIKQGSNFIASITVKNPGTFNAWLENLAMTYTVPGGWEINNERMSGAYVKHNAIEYQDFRDDKVISYFNLRSGQEIKIDIPLTAAYSGTFYQPPVACETMYYDDVYSYSASRKVTVSSNEKITQ